MTLLGFKRVFKITDKEEPSDVGTSEMFRKSRKALYIDPSDEATLSETWGDQIRF